MRTQRLALFTAASLAVAGMGVGCNSDTHIPEPKAYQTRSHDDLNDPVSVTGTAGRGGMTTPAAATYGAGTAGTAGAGADGSAGGTVNRSNGAGVGGPAGALSGRTDPTGQDAREGVGNRGTDTGSTGGNSATGGTGGTSSSGGATSGGTGSSSGGGASSGGASGGGTSGESTGASN